MKVTMKEIKDLPKKKTTERKTKLTLKDGTRVPGATTIAGLLDKPFLVKWANKLGKQNIDVTEYVNQQAKQGTLIHAVIESHNTQQPADLSNYSDSEIDIATKVFYEHYMKWENLHQVEPIFSEMSLVSETYKFGGIIDFYAKVDGVYTVVDFKTSKSINNEHILQVSSYIQLLRENGYQVDQLLILNVKKETETDLEEKYLKVEDTLTYWEMFKHLIEVYWLKKELKWE